MKRIAVLGCTGSIGTQTLDVIENHPGRLKVSLLAAGTNLDLLASQARSHRPEFLWMEDLSRRDELEALARETGSRILTGPEELAEAVCGPGTDTVLAAISGFAGLPVLWAALKAGKEIALANKEALVAAGHLIMPEAARRNVRILPVDSEHSAIFQCLENSRGPVEQLTITASGGAFRDFPASELSGVTPEMALKHPNWNMGRKITIDSATLANKGLEVLEAHHLFSVDLRDIDVVVHRESIVHSLVRFADGSVLAQLGLPDMRLPIQYALSTPERWENSFPRLDLVKAGALHFESPRRQDFPCLDLAYEAGGMGPSGGLAYNTANELAVEEFLRGRLGFTGIPERIREVLQRYGDLPVPTIEDVLETDREIRNYWRTGR